METCDKSVLNYNLVKILCGISKLSSGKASGNSTDTKDTIKIIFRDSKTENICKFYISQYNGT